MKTASLHISIVGKAVLSVAMCVLLMVCFALPTKAFAATEIPIGAESSTGYSDQITIKVDGTDFNVTLTRSDLSDLLNSTPVACNYLTNEKGTSNYYWKVLAVKNYITLDKLFEQAKWTNESGQEISASEYWKSGARLQFTAYSKPTPTADYYKNMIYTEWGDNFTYDNLQSQTIFYKLLQSDGSFYQNNSAAVDSVPIAIAFDRVSARVTGTADSAFSTIKNSVYTPTTQFIMGLNSTTLNVVNGQGDNMGKRLPQGITAITIYPK
jgi:hypothetical protein